MLDDALGKRSLTLAVFRAQGRNASLDGRLVDARRSSPAGLHRAAAGQGVQDLRGFRLGQGTCQQGDFLALLHGEGQPALQLGVQLVFAIQVHRAVQQRTGRRHPEALAQALMGMPQHRQRLFQVAAPDVAAVDQAQGQHLVGRQPVEDGRILLRGAHQIEMQAVQGQAGGQAEVVFQAAEIGGDQLLQRFALDQVVGPLEGVLPVLGQIQHQDRLVDLHPLHTEGIQALEDLAIDRQQPLQQVELVEFAALGLAEPEVGQRADQHGFDLVTQGVGLLDLFEKLLPAQAEVLLGRELRHQVVVVGIEPLGHLLRMGAAAAAVAAVRRHGATGHGEQRLQGGLAAVMRAETLGNHAEGQGVRQHLVIPGEVAHRQKLDTGVLLQLPVFGAQATANGAQAGFVQFALPEGFLGLLQFTVAADTRKAEGMGQGHVVNLHASDGVHCRQP
ncbi:hypothetical protein D9M68_504450 [compost metagenome]